MPATKDERAHFAAIRVAMEAERDARRREDLGKSVHERVAEGLALGAQLPRSPERDALDEARALGQAELHVRARRLGLYRP